MGKLHLLPLLHAQDRSELQSILLQRVGISTNGPKSGPGPTDVLPRLV